jgi:hypothetical protein
VNYHELILEGLKEWLSTVSDRKKDAEISMLTRFIKLMGEKDFNIVFPQYFLDIKEFDEGWFRFHKSMRQTDFFDFDNGHVDMLFWEFIHLTETPYKVFKTFTEKIRVGVINEFDNDLDGNLGWDKFGFFRIR